jgi:hypothetical protein
MAVQENFAFRFAAANDILVLRVDLSKDLKCYGQFSAAKAVETRITASPSWRA